MMAAVLTAILVAGCGPDSTAPEIPVSSVQSYTLPPDGPKVPAPRGLAYGPDGALYVLDNAGRVLVYAEDGTLRVSWSMPEYDVGKPEGICLLSDGRIVVADTHYHRVVFFDHEGHVTGMHGGLGSEPGQFVYPVAVCQDDAGHYYVCEYGGHDRVQKFDADGTWMLEFGGFGTEPGKFQRPSGVVWESGQVFVADAINNRVQVFRDSGEFVSVVEADTGPPPLHYPYDLARGPGGDLFVVEYGAGRVTRLHPDGHVLGVFGSPGNGDRQFATPWGIAVNAEGRITVADTGNRRLVELIP